MKIYVSLQKSGSYVEIRSLVAGIKWKPSLHVQIWYTYTHSPVPAHTHTCSSSSCVHTVPKDIEQDLQIWWNDVMAVHWLISEILPLCTIIKCQLASFVRSLWMIANHCVIANSLPRLCMEIFNLRTYSRASICAVIGACSCAGCSSTFCTVLLHSNVHAVVRTYPVEPCLSDACIHTHAHKRAYMCTCKLACTWTHVHTHLYMYTCPYTCIYVRMHTEHSMHLDKKEKNEGNGNQRLPTC